MKKRHCRWLLQKLPLPSLIDSNTAHLQRRLNKRRSLMLRILIIYSWWVLSIKDYCLSNNNNNKQRHYQILPATATTNQLPALTCIINYGFVINKTYVSNAWSKNSKNEEPRRDWGPALELQDHRKKVLKWSLTFLSIEFLFSVCMYALLLQETSCFHKEHGWLVEVMHQQAHYWKDPMTGYRRLSADNGHPTILSEHTFWIPLLLPLVANCLRKSFRVPPIWNHKWSWHSWQS